MFTAHFTQFIPELHQLVSTAPRPRRCPYARVVHWSSTCGDSSRRLRRDRYLKMRAQNPPAAASLACQPLAAQEREALRDEVVESSRDPMRFLPKIDEVRGVREPDPRQPGIISFLRRHALRGGKQSVLELGCAAGNVLRMVLTELDRRGGPGALRPPSESALRGAMASAATIAVDAADELSVLEGELASVQELGFAFQVGEHKVSRARLSVSAADAF